jgi:hypothetical protein
MADESPPDTYSAGPTIFKGALPLGILAGVEILSTILVSVGVHVPKEMLYQGGVVIYSGIMALVNWIKNRKK